VATAALISPLI